MKACRRGFGLGGAHIEFQISGDGYALRPAADLSQAFRVGLALRQHAAKTAEQRLPQLAKHLVTRPGAVGDAGVDHGDGNAAPETTAEKVGPELGLSQNEQPRLERVQIGSDGPGQVERAIEDAVCSEAFAGQRLAGARGRRHGDKIAGQLHVESLNQAADRQHFAY